MVEDDESDVELILNTLKKNNVVNEIVVATNGQEALDFLGRKGKFGMRAAGNPISILLDINLPDMSGFDILKYVKNNQSLKEIPIVILTGENSNLSIAECYKNSANAYIVKPVVFGDFVEIIKELGIFWAMINEPPPRSG